jgi:autotransporter translocation and assembly factor TamB
MRWHRSMQRALLGLAVFTALVMLTLVWASRSELVLRWAIGQAASRLPGELIVEDVRGSITEPITVEHVRYVDDRISFEARRVSMQWAPWQLVLHRTLSIQALSIESLAIHRAQSVKSSVKPTLPNDLVMPIAIAIEGIAISSLTVESAGKRFKMGPLLAAYSADETAHHFRIERLVSQWATATADLHMAAVLPYGLNGVLGLQGQAGPQWPFRFSAELSGEIARIASTWHLDLQDTAIKAPRELPRSNRLSWRICPLWRTD